MLVEFLRNHGACPSAVEWAMQYDDDPAKAWAECDRGNWMLWIAAKLRRPRSELVWGACACARQAWGHMPEAGKRAIEIAEAWVKGETNLEQVIEDTLAAYAATHAAYAAGDAAHAALAAATHAISAIFAPDPATHTAYAATFAAAAAAHAIDTANICRAFWRAEVVDGEITLEWSYM